MHSESIGSPRVPFRVGERLSAEKLNELSSYVDQSLGSTGGGNRAIGSFGQAFDTPPEVYLWVRVTGVKEAEGSPSGEPPRLLYSFEEMVEDQVTKQYTLKEDGIVGGTEENDNNHLIEVNNTRVAPGVVVLAWKGLGNNYFFVADNASIEWVRADSKYDHYPMYSATKVWFDVETRTFKLLDACYLIEANKAELSLERRYLSTYVGLYSDVPLYVTSCCGEGTPVDPLCADCLHETPRAWDVTLADFTGDCAPVNGTYVLSWTSGCSWSHAEEGLTITLVADSEEYTLTIVSSPFTTVYTKARETQECCEPVTLDLDTSDCAGYPSTVTLTPSCEVQVEEGEE